MLADAPASPVEDSGPRDGHGDVLRILHVITTLDTGGAERMLAKLVRAQRGVGWPVVVVVLATRGVIADDIEAAGARVVSLGLARGRVPGLNVIGRLADVILETRPDIVQSWMYHADLIAGLAARRVGHRAVVWGIRNTIETVNTSARLSRAVFHACRLLSGRLAARVVANSHRAADQHVDAGYPAATMRVVPNGFELDRFVPDALRRAAVRRAWQVLDDEPVVGLVARHHPQKDTAGFLAAAAKLVERHPSARIVVAGPGQVVDAADIAAACRSHPELAARLLCLGEQRDVAALLDGLDVFVLASAYGEGFPNALGEAMAMAKACVVTDTGDCAEIVGTAGRVVRPRDPGALADALGEVLALDEAARRAIGTDARARVVALYGMPAIRDAFGAIYDDVLAATRGPR